MTPLGSALLMVMVVGCGSEAVVVPPPPPHPGGPHLSIAASNTAMQRGGSAQVTVVALLFSSVRAPVDLSITGLGSGVTASFEPASIPVTSTTSTLTLAAGTAASAGTFFATLCGLAPGIAGSCTQLQVTITP